MLTLDYIYNVDVLEGLRSLPDCSIDLVVTSPPYNRGYYCKHKTPTKWDFCKTKSRSIVYGDFDDSMLPEDYARWQSEILSECIRVIKPEGSIFYNHKDILFGHLTVHPTWVYNFPLKQTMIWDRSSTISMDKNYFFPITEWVFWIKKDFDSRCYFDRHSAMFKSNVWRFAPDKKNSHPAPFPLELPLNCVLSCSQPGGGWY